MKPTDMRDDAGEQTCLWGVMVTFHRTSTLKSSLHAISHQTRRIDRLIIVDNGSESEAEVLAEEFGAVYVEAGDNLGPAGGVALGFKAVLNEAADHDWVMIFDDDDPPRDARLIEEISSLAERWSQSIAKLGAVGLVGARYNSRSGTIRRVQDEELSGRVQVDYIGGGHLPLYSVKALREVGLPDSNFFFGFDDLEFGLRLRSAGYSILAAGDLWMRDRVSRGNLGLRRDSPKLRTSPRTTAWRRYYSVRNLILIARRYGSPRSVFVTSVFGGGKAIIESAVNRQPIAETLLLIRAVVDGVSGRAGRTVDPGAGAKLR